MAQMIYMGELWCYLHIPMDDIEKEWFRAYHEKLYPGVQISWPDYVCEEAKIENTAREIDRLAADKPGGNSWHIHVNGEVFYLHIDFCQTCGRYTLLNASGVCHRCFHKPPF